MYMDQKLTPTALAPMKLFNLISLPLVNDLKLICYMYILGLILSNFKQSVQLTMSRNPQYSCTMSSSPCQSERSIIECGQARCSNKHKSMFGWYIYVTDYISGNSLSQGFLSKHTQNADKLALLTPAVDLGKQVVILELSTLNNSFQTQQYLSITSSSFPFSLLHPICDLYPQSCPTLGCACFNSTIEHLKYILFDIYIV